MLHSERLAVEVRREQRLWMAGRRQVDRHEIRVRIPRRVKIHRRLHARPISLRHRWVGAKQVIESQTAARRSQAEGFPKSPFAGMCAAIHVQYFTGGECRVRQEHSCVDDFFDFTDPADWV